MDTSSDRPRVSICYSQNTADSSSARWYRNVSYPTEDSILPKIFDFWWRTQMGPEDLLPRHSTPCPDNTVCYPHSNTVNNISTYFFGNGTISINDSLGGGLICKAAAEEWCFASQITDGRKNATSVCKKFFFALGNLYLSNAELDIQMKCLTAFMAVSLPFLVATFAVYTMLPELRNLHGLIVRSYISCCFGTFVMTIIRFTNVTLICEPFLSIPWHFTYMATFCWLNVMSFDIWWTFRTLQDRSKQSFRKKYIIYSIYGWGISMLMIGVGFIIDLVPNLPKGMVRPGIRTGCLLGVYRQIPITIMVAFNVCFLMLATISIYRQRKVAAESLDGSESRRYNDEKNRFYIYVRIFVIMGMTWIVEIQWVFVKRLPFQPYFGLILQFPNTTQGVSLFILFVCSDRTKRLLSKRLGFKDWRAIQWIERVMARVTFAQRTQVS